MVIDLRPQEERDGVGLTELSGKCNKDVYRIADVASDPLKVEVLKADLAQQMGLASDGKTLTVLNWSIYYNKQTKHGGLKLSDIGIQGYAIPGKKKEKKPGSKCSRKESAGGWYADGEVTTHVLPARLGVLGHLRRQAVSTCASFIRRAGRSKGSSRAPRTTREALLDDRAQDRRGAGHGHRSVATSPCATSPSCTPARSCCGVSSSGTSPPSSTTSMPTPAIWLNALGISAIIGVALYLSVREPGKPPPDRWTCCACS